jgi:predicted membrane protein
MGGRNLAGLLLITLGVIFLLDTLNVFGDDTSIISDYWPVLIIGVGFMGWAQRGFKYAMGPFLVMAVGGILLAGELTDFDVWRLWPVFLIIIGLSFIWQRQSTRSRRSRGRPVTAGHGGVKINHFLNGDERHVDGEFKGGTVSVVMGSGKLDLTRATLPPGGAVLDVSAVMGSYEVFVPDSWNVAFEADAFLGSIDDRRRRGPPPPDGAPTLALRGNVFMGSVEIKS